MSTERKAASLNGRKPSGCDRCGGVEAHVACPVCEGRGCISPREIAEKLGLQEALDLTEVTAVAIAKAVDGRVFKSIEEAKKIERERSEQIIAMERKRIAEAERRLQEQLKEQGTKLMELRTTAAEAEARARTVEEVLAKRRHQPAAVGRVAERDFASLVGAQSDFRLSQKLPRGGDYEAWIKVDVGDGTLAEVDEPILIDVKRDSAALQTVALTKLVRDCKARGRLVGALVADRLEEVAEVFGSPRVRVVDGVTLILTSVEAFANELRLLGPYLKQLADARRSGDTPLVAALAASIGEVGQLVAEIERHADTIAVALEKHADQLRDVLVSRACARIRTLVSEAHRRIATSSAAETSLKSAS